MAHPSDIANRGPITIALMLSTVMNSLDTTIANVALPHIQGSVGATSDQIAWVLTSYLIASAIMTPTTGWLSLKLGKKVMFMVSIAGFTGASMLCGLAHSLGEIVGFRLLQGIFGASLAPLSQAVLLDLYAPEEIGRIMAVWGAGVLLGPIFGPALGGWLTDAFSWRWVFYINLPVGALALIGVLIFMSPHREGTSKPFDFLGFGALAVFVGAFQLILDRGSGQDWFTSSEIWTYVVLAAIAFYVFVVQTLTARHPFFDRALAADRNFVSCTVFGFFIGILLFSVMALLPVMLQQFMGYTALEAGLATMPRGLGSFAAMFVVGRLIGRVDTRLILFAGLSISTVALWQMSRFSLDMTVAPVVFSGVIQGVGIGLIFVPLSAQAFITLPSSLRPEATALYTLVRSLGSSVGISIMEALWTRNASVSHADLAAHVNPSNPVVASQLGQTLSSASGLDVLNGEITRQAAMVAYVDDFWLMVFITLACMPLLLLMRTPRFESQGVHAYVD